MIKGVLGRVPLYLECACANKKIDPATAHGTSSIFDSLKPIGVERLQEGELLVGRELAKNLGLRLGDNVGITFMRVDLGLSGIQPRMMGFRVAGIFESHISEYDRSYRSCRTFRQRKDDTSECNRVY